MPKPLNMIFYYKLSLIIMKDSTLTGEAGNLLEQDEIKKGVTQLAFLFNDPKDPSNPQRAMQYLTQFKAQHPKSTSPLLDACLFSLPPSEDEWDVNLWRSIIFKQNPTSPNDLIMRLLPFAGKIEKYVAQNKTQLEKEIRESTIEEMKQRFSRQFDKLQISSTENNQNITPKEAKLLQETIDKQFNFYLRTGILPKTKVTTEQTRQLKEKKDNLTPTDLQALARITAEVNQAHHIKKIKGTPLSITNLDKTKYVTQELEAAAETIGAIVKQRVEQLLSPTTPLTTLEKYAELAVYARAHQNPRAAALFFAERIPEETFNHYLSLIPQDDPIKIPPVMIDGKTISPEYAGYYLTKLDPHDPRAATLGKYTSCCQSMGDVGVPFMALLIQMGDFMCYAK